MIDAITFETAHLLGDALPAAHRLRYRIFVERQKYEVPTHRNMEWDQFDTPAAVYLLWRDEEHAVRAVTRLIPTSMPYMIQQLWPDLVARDEVPQRDDVWEVTRLGVDRTLPPEQRARALGELVCAFAEFGLLNGINEYIFVTPEHVVDAALRRAGLYVRQLGDRRRLGSLPVIAARTAVTPTALANLQHCHGIAGSVLNIVGGAPRALAA